MDPSTHPPAWALHGSEMASLVPEQEPLCAAGWGEPLGLSQPLMAVYPLPCLDITIITAGI